MEIGYCFRRWEHWGPIIVPGWTGSLPSKRLPLPFSRDESAHTPFDFPGGCQGGAVERDLVARSYIKIFRGGVVCWWFAFLIGVQSYFAGYFLKPRVRQSPIEAQLLPMGNPTNRAPNKRSNRTLEYHGGDS